MLPGDFQTTPFSFRVLNVSVSLPGSTTRLNQTNLICILYVTFVLEQICCPAFQASRGILPSSLFIRSMPKSQSWLMCSLSTLLPISEGKCSIQMQFQVRLSAIHVSSMLADSIIDNCRDGMVIVWFLAWIFSWWSEQLSLWALRSWKVCVFYPSSAKMFSYWPSSSDLRSSGSKPEMSWSILSFQWYKWHQNLVIFSYHYHLC